MYVGGYVDTIAFNTKSSARHGGDPGWIRHANGGIVTRPDSNLHGVEAIGTAATVATTLAQLGKTFMDLRQSKIDAKSQKSAANAAQRQAEAATAAAIAATQAQTAAVQSQSDQQEHSQTKLILVGAGVIGALVIGGILLFRRR